MIHSYVAGAVVLNPHGQVLVVCQNNDSWSLPKGHIDDEETEAEAAVREIYEESGVKGAELIKKLGSYSRPRIGKNGNGDNREEMKHISIFLARTNQMELQPIDTWNTDAKWVEVDEVAGILTHAKDKEFFDSIKAEVARTLR